MTPGLLFPLGLAALAALIVPLVIHIARRTEEKPTDFAALRWLRQKPRPKSRLRFDERLLLAIRLLLLALVALWLAQPAVFGAADSRPYVAVVPGVDLARAGEIEDQPVADYRRAHWLAPGFPEATTPAPPTAGTAATVSLMRQLDADLPAETPLVLMVPEVLSGVDAERPRLSRRVEWRVAPGRPQAAQVAPEVFPPLSVRHDAGHSSGLTYLRAAAAAWAPEGREADLDVAGLDAPLPGPERRLAWLAGGSLPPELVRWVEQGGVVMVASDAVAPEGPRAVVWRDALGAPLAEAQAIGKGRLIRLTRPLIPAQTPQLLEADFPDRLAALLQPVPTPPTRVLAADHAPLTGAAHAEPAPLDLRPWLAVLIGIVLLGERWLAASRRRGATP